MLMLEINGITHDETTTRADSLNSCHNGFEVSRGFLILKVYEDINVVIAKSKSL